MPNTFEYASWLTMESLDILENSRAVSQFFNTDYSKDFKLKFPVGDSISVPFPDQGVIRNGLTYNPTAITRRHATIAFDDPFGSDFEWDNAEAMLKAPRGREKVSRDILQPRMELLAQEIDSRCALYAYQHAANVVGALGTNPSTYDATSAAARQMMVEYGCPPSGEKAMIVTPAVMRAVKTSNIALHNPVSDLSKQQRTGIIQHADGFEWYESMSLYQHTAGTTTTPTVTTTQTGAAAISTLAITCTTGNTFLKGDKFTIGAVRPVNPATKRTFAPSTTLKHFTVTADATAVSSSATISFSPPIYGPLSANQNVDALPLATAALVMWPGTTSPNGKIGSVGVALHKDAFAMVSAELEEPKASSVELYSSKRDPDSGVAISFIRQFDGRSRKMINRFDVWLGFGEFYNDSCAVALAFA